VGEKTRSAKQVFCSYFQSEGISLMAFEDKVLKCKDCGSDFVFTVGEQEFYAEKGFENEPTRCKECRTSRKHQRDGRESTASREMHDAVCAACGVETKVPFKPRNDRPIYCRDCFSTTK
jgi:CxxC-x17-CxxC domain-containing protein